VKALGAMKSFIDSVMIPDHTPQERQAVKYSDVEPEMLSEDEFKLDAKGRVVYINYYFIAYPKDINGHRVRKIEAI